MRGGEMKTTKARQLQEARRHQGDAGDGAPDVNDPRQVAAYVADVTLEMRNLARNANLTFLSYLLEMSFQEAFDLTQPDGKVKNRA